MWYHFHCSRINMPTFWFLKFILLRLSCEEHSSCIYYVLIASRRKVLSLSWLKVGGVLNWRRQKGWLEIFYCNTCYSQTFIFSKGFLVETVRIVGEPEILGVMTNTREKSRNGCRLEAKTIISLVHFSFFYLYSTFPTYFVIVKELVIYLFVNFWYILFGNHYCMCQLLALNLFIIKIWWRTMKLYSTTHKQGEKMWHS